MIITCPSCKTKYSVDSISLKPKGKNVQCANCNNVWFQQIQDIAKELNKNQSQNHAKEKISQNIHEKRNLPSTHVKNSTAFNKFDFLLLITLIAIIALMLNEKEVDNLYNFILNLKTLTYESIQEGIMSLFSKSS